LSRHDLDMRHGAQGGIRDQEVAGVDIVSDGELQRDNMIDYFAERLPGVKVDQGSSASTTTSTERGALEARHRGAQARRRRAS
jgi:methionine synthase II (cobalamin-independent)